jgi:hypothetical protein
MNHVNTAAHCRCVHHKVVAILIILLGLFFLVMNFGLWPDVPSFVIRGGWPTIILLIGVAKLFSGSCKCYMQPQA